MPNFRARFDIDTYKTRFLGGMRQYHFFVLFQFPNQKDMDSLKGFGNLAASIGTGVNQIAGNFMDIEKVEGPGAEVTNVLNKYGPGATKNFLNVFGLGADQDLIPYLVKSTQIPSSSLNEIVIDYQVMPIKIPGRREFGDWTVSFNIDNNGEILKKFYDWQRFIVDPMSGRHTSWTKTVRDQEIYLLDYSGNAVKSYKLIGAWPKNISEVSLDYGGEEVAGLEVTFTYQFYEMMEAPSTFAADILKRGINNIIGKIPT